VAKKPSIKKEFPNETSGPRVVVKFRAGLGLTADSLVEGRLAREDLGPWQELTASVPGIRLRAVFEFESIDFQSLIRRATELDPTYQPADFSSYYYVDAPPATDLKALVLALRKWNNVELVYIANAGPDPGVNASNDYRSPNQGYLDPAPDGIDAEYAWGFTGGDGAGQRLIDIERGWTLDHEDLSGHGIAPPLSGTILDSSRSHGTAVLGEICAVDNNKGCVGIVPNIKSVGVISYIGTTIENAITTAIDNLSFGDVLLLEIQVYLNYDPASATHLMGPVEAYDACFAAIRLATALGIIVVEAGGNGTEHGPDGLPPLDMDTFVLLANGLKVFDPSVRDSGAVMVTAATSVAQHKRMINAPFGKRIDCYAWGENINTLSSDKFGCKNCYTSSFSGTSGASAIIAGAALAVQGRAEAQLGFRLSPRQMRAILRDGSTGTKRAAAETTDIGVMPDLKAIFNTVLNAAPDLYMRDFVGDSGDPHVGAVSMSPDIIVRKTAVVDPQASFGAGSGNENSAVLSDPVELGQDNFVYVRALNRGGSAATNVQATIYWAPVASLVTPNLWTLIGKTNAFTLPSGNQLVVSDAVVWPKAKIPAAGHFCFVALIGSDQEPQLEPADFKNWDTFLRFVRENNNVTWRNFNVVDNEPDAADPSLPEGFKALSFLAPGAPDQGRRMALELIGGLPQGGLALLEMPIPFYEHFQAVHQLVAKHIDRERNIAVVPINGQGRTILGEVLFARESHNPMRLLVKVPEKLRSSTYQFAVRQTFDNIEVGRVTWQLQPQKAREHLRIQ
jgi:serine protease